MTGSEAAGRSVSRERTPLEYALMCLIARAPMTGSELTRLLTRYPLAGTGKSPGAVYPALYRLAEAGLVCGRPRWVRSDRSQALRARLRRAAAGGPLMARERGTVREFGLTHMGVVRLRVWATRRVTRTEVLERPEHLMLRFSLCTGLVGPSAARRVALQCRRVCRDLVADMSREIAGRGGTASPSARLAMECSLDLLEARVGWSRRAEWELARQARREPELDTPSPTREVMVVLDGLPRRIRKRIRCPLRGELSPTGRSRTERTRRARRIGWEPGRGPRARPP